MSPLKLWNQDKRFLVLKVFYAQFHILNCKITDNSEIRIKKRKPGIPRLKV